MKYIIYCTLTGSYCGIVRNNKVTVAWSLKKARKFASKNDAESALIKLNPEWRKHMVILEYTESTQRQGRKNAVGSGIHGNDKPKARLLSFNQRG